MPPDTRPRLRRPKMSDAVIIVGMIVFAVIIVGMLWFLYAIVRK